MPTRRALLLPMLAAIAALPARAEDFWGRPLPDQPANFIFGYGSLINTPSRNATATRAVAAIPVRVSAAFGYVRAWNDRSPYGFTALGLRKPGAGESATTINGVLFPVVGEDMAAFDAREEGYVRVEVPRADIEAVSWQELPARGRIWVYVPGAAARAAGIGPRPPDIHFPLVESYIDVVIEGGLEYGPDFAREIIVTTKDWSRYWLNDRELARRPWALDSRAAAVDKLLAAFAPHYVARMFPEEYAATRLRDLNAHPAAPSP
jgi:hypothetical protein